LAHKKFDFSRFESDRLAFEKSHDEKSPSLRSARFRLALLKLQPLAITLVMSADINVAEIKLLCVILAFLRIADFKFEFSKLH